MSETPQYKIGDVVNGHRWSGTAWEPVGQEVPAPVSGAAPAAVSAKKPWFKKWWGVGLIVLGILMVIGVATSGGSDTDTASADKPAATAEQTPGETETPAEEPTVEEPTEEPAAELTVAQKNAIRSAEGYLSFSAFSKKGLIAQLKYEEYAQEDAEFAVDNIDVDWNEQAVKSAEAYLETSAFSRQGLIDQLKYEKYTQKQAEQAVDAVGL